MGLFGGESEFMGLDIGTSALRVVELYGSGKNKIIGRYGMTPLEPGISISDSRADQQKLAEAIKTFIAQSGIRTKNVAVGLPVNKVFNTVVDIDRLSQSELAKSILYQADSLIPTPLSESKIDWAMLGDSPVSRTKIEVLLSSVSNDYIERRLDMLESIGLNVIAFEPESIAMTRAMVAPTELGAQVIMDIGTASTDLVITMGAGPRLIRAIPIGLDTLIRAAVQNLNIDAKQATQFVFKFGLAQDKLEGQIYNALIGTVDSLMQEVEKSIKFFQGRHKGIAVEKIIMTGGASTLPLFPLYVVNKFNIAVEIGNAWRNVAFPPEKQNDLLAVSNFFAVAAGLALREG